MDDEDTPDNEDFEGDLPPALDPAASKRRESRAKRELREADEFWTGILATEVGRREMWRLIQADGHAFEERFACGPNGFPQVESTWFQAGEQAFAMRLYQKLLALDPLNVREMHFEHDHRFKRFADKERS